MNNINCGFRKPLSIAALVALSVGVAHAQNALQFTAVTPTAENAILLYWASNPNEVYEIDYADQLNGNDDGTTAWLPLYTDYPSHGTNTFIADAGNYSITPEIPHPRLSPMRFYRVMLAQANDAATNPIVSVTSPTDGTVLSGDVTVSVSGSTSDILGEIRLYVDGEEQWLSLSGTNSQGTNVFVINTCEWLNGPHVIYATAKSQSGFEGVANGEAITYGRSVSSYLNVSFSNLITHIDLSERFFEPALGQTQHVSATFAANVNWTLQIQDASSNTVRTGTGSGAAMGFDWDGTGDGGVSIPDGAYTYLFTAETNGLAMPFMEPPPGDTNPPPPMFSASTSGEMTDNWFPTSAREAVAVGWGFFYMQPPPMPPVKTNDVWMNWKDVYGPQPLTIAEIPLPTKQLYLRSLGMASATTLDGGALQQDSATSSYSGAASQSTRAPKRKPRVGVKGEAGTFGMCYKTYGTNGFGSNHPITGWPYPLPTSVAIDGQTRTQQTVDRSVPSFKPFAEGFSQVMQQKGWKQSFCKGDGQWTAATVKKAAAGGTNIFNTVNFGILMTHGSYGNDGTTGTEKDGLHYTYNWLGANDYIRLSDYDFGSPGTNGLRWMTIMACNILRPANYTSMNNAGKIPVNDNLHLLLGPSTDAWSNDRLGKYYAGNLVYTNLTIVNALADAIADSYTENPKGINTIVRIGVSGWASCFNDTLLLYNDPDLNGLQYNERTSFIP
jgi:hypothetical protein